MARDESKNLIYLSSDIILNEARHYADSRFSVRNQLMVFFWILPIFYVNASMLHRNILPPYLDRQDWFRWILK
jgi:hypothetical protein